MEPSRQGFTKFLRIGEILYFFLVAFSFYSLLLSRTGEARTVWEVLHPAFIPTLFVATSLLLAILLTPEKVAHKLLFIIIHSILIHSLFSIVFLAGDLSGQQMFLGRIRLVYDNAVLHGWPPWPVETVQSLVYEWFRGINFQAALSVVFARMLSIDILWIHLFLVPVLWGVFTPIAVYLTTYTFTKNKKVAVLASLLLSAFPYATYFGAISVPNSLGYIFFLYSLYFMLKNLDSNDSKTRVLMLTFSFFSLLSHHLTGIISFSLLLLSLTFKSYRGEKSPSITAKISLVTSFILCASLLPFSLIYLRLFRAGTYTAFTLDKFYELPLEEIAGLFLIGELTYGFNLETILLNVIGPALALLYMIYRLYRLKKNPTAEFRIHLLFLSAAFLMMLVDYRILKLFMERLPLNEERLWVFRDFIAAPFVALAIYAAGSSLKTFLKATSLPTISLSSLKALPKRTVLHVLSLIFTLNFAGLRALCKRNSLRILSMLFTLNILIPLVLGGWITLSLSAAYPQVAPLQTTWYELEAVKYIEENTKEKYVVIGDMWTIFAGEMIAGLNNPRAYYFGEYNKTGYDLFVNMKQDPSPQWMLLAMNYTDTTTAYFIVTEPRLGTEEYNRIVTQALQNGIQVYGVFGEGKLYVFYYEK
ncbi:hypothetical protein E3J74_08930 [Candidatus Bathyarchaeota archaeon]|nr:MAG: hypothetical protein E3J74_08930 [Candidatus Bathyarchaeota archaeon]